jgi:hypothetical protein
MVSPTKSILPFVELAHGCFCQNGVGSAYDLRFESAEHKESRRQPQKPKQSPRKVFANVSTFRPQLILAKNHIHGGSSHDSEAKQGQDFELYGGYIAIEV